MEVLRNKGTRRGKIIAGFYDHPRDFIGSMLVGNNISLVVFTSLMELMLRPWIVPHIGDNAWTLLSITIIVTLIVLVFGEFLPKTLSRLYANEMLIQFAFPLRFFRWFLAIPTWIMTTTTNFFLKTLFKVPADDATEALTKVDLVHYISDSISEEEHIDKEILSNALNLFKVRVRDCMIPRTEIVSHDMDDPMEELIQTFKESRHSRILIMDGDIENIIGYVHHQQFLNNPRHIKRLILDILYVPEAMHVQDLMATFIKTGSTIACVVDEFGGTAGMITLEDILEEIFGEIVDEHDEEALYEEQISEDEYVLSGRIEIDYINEKYDHLSIPSGEFHTLSGYIVMTSGSIPEEEGLAIELDGYKFIIEQLSETKIERVRVIRLKTEEED